jgi:hypothetical protein
VCPQPSPALLTPPRVQGPPCPARVVEVAYDQVGRLLPQGSALSGPLSRRRPRRSAERGFERASAPAFKRGPLEWTWETR